MDYRTLGRTGVKVSPLCLGGMLFGDRTDEEEANKLINQALDRGINFIDTANRYGGEPGQSERIIGKALQSNGQRNRVILATKVHYHMYPDDPNGGGIHRRHIIQEVEESLKRLQTDYIDLYYLHRSTAGVPMDETLRALDDLIHAGKILYIGDAGAWRNWRLVQSLWVSQELGLNRMVAIQPQYNMLMRTAELNYLSMAEEFGLAIMPHSPLHGGFLTGKYSRDNLHQENTRFGTEWSGIWDAGLTNEAWELLEVLRVLADEKDCAVSQIALAWVLGMPNITSAIIGPRTVDQLLDNLGSLDIEITDEDHERIDAISYPGLSLWKP